jgi:hypothetical protein
MAAEPRRNCGACGICRRGSPRCMVLKPAGRRSRMF